MARFIDRTGETIMATNGQKMTIIEYNNYGDMTVQFEDGTILKHKNYQAFSQGQIANPNYGLKSKRLGETIITQNGQKATIVEYFNCCNITVKFEDGTIVRNKMYNDFIKGIIRKSSKDALKNRVGESNIASNGQKMTIVKYYSSNNITVQFEDGTIVKNRTYGNFKSGIISNPSKPCDNTRREKYAKKYIGKTSIANNGQKMTIIDYNNFHDITIQFEDGTIVEHRPYNLFERGEIENPNAKPFADTSINEIILLYYFSKIGFKKKKCWQEKKYGLYEYDAFSKKLKLAIEYDGDPRGHTVERDKRKTDDAEKRGITIWRIRTNKVPELNDERNRIFELDSIKYFSPEFEDVCKKIVYEINRVYNTNYILDIDFERDKAKIMRYIKTEYCLKNKRVGETKLANNGQKMTITEYYGCNDITIRFEDGTVVEHKQYGAFKLGTIKNPNFNKNTSKQQKAS